MNQAKRIRRRLEDIEARLRGIATMIRHSETDWPAGADLDEMLDHLPFTKERRRELDLERQNLLKEKAGLERELNQLPDHLREEGDDE